MFICAQTYSPCVPWQKALICKLYKIVQDYLQFLQKSGQQCPVIIIASMFDILYLFGNSRADLPETIRKIRGLFEWKGIKNAKSDTDNIK